MSSVPFKTLMKLSLLIIFAFGDISYFPNICRPLPEDLHLCLGETLDFSLLMTDFENPDLICNSTSFPEKCFLLTNSSEIFISQSGSLSFTGKSSGKHEYDLLIFDENRETTTEEPFNYYNFARIYKIIFEVTEEVSEFYLKQRPDCGKCPECGICIDIECGVPFTGQFSGNYSGRLEFSLISRGEVEIFIEKSGIFYLVAECKDSSQIVEWEVEVYDKATRCSKVFEFKNYPNSVPEIKITKEKYFLYQSEEFNASFTVVDLNHRIDEIKVSVNDSRFFIEIGENQVFFLICNESLPPGSYFLQLNAEDSGILGNNIKSSALLIEFQVKNPESFPLISFPKLIIAKYSGNFYYVFQDFDVEKYYFQVNPFDTGVVVVDSQKLVLFWDHELISAYNPESLIEIEIILFEVDCNCTLNSKKYSLLIEILDPPVILPSKPLVAASDCLLEFSISTRFKYIESLTYSFEGFENFSAPSTTGSWFQWKTPALTEKKILKFSIVALFEDHCKNQAVSKMDFWVTIYVNHISTKVIPEDLIVTSADSDFSLNLIDYVDYFNLSLVSFEKISNGFNFDLLFSTFFVSKYDSKDFISNEDSKIAEVKILVIGSCNISTVLSFDLLILKTFPRISIDKELWCVVEEYCEIDFQPFLSVSIEKISDFSFKTLPDSMNFTSSKLIWIPSNDYISSGFITYQLSVQRVQLSSEFVINVYRRPLIRSFSQAFYSVALGEYWEYEIEAFSLEGYKVTCFNTNLTLLDSGPALLGVVLAWSSVSNEFKGKKVNFYQGVLTCYFNESIYLESSVLYSLNIYSPCQILHPGTFLPTFGQEWEEDIAVYDPDGFEVQLKAGKNRPFTLSVDFLNRTSKLSWFSLKWFPDFTGFYEFELICVKIEKNFGKYPPEFEVFAKENVSLYIGKEVNVSDVEICDLHVLTADDWVCVIKALNLFDCQLQVSEITGMVAEMVEGNCRIVWSKDGIILNGVRQTDMIGLVLFNEFYTPEYIYFSLYPNDVPVVVSENQFELVVGLVPFREKIQVVDSNQLIFELVSFPDGMIVDQNGEIFWISPEYMLVPNATFIMVKITDSHPHPISISLNITINHLETVPPPNPRCPDLVEIEVDVPWVWDTRGDNKTYNYSISSPGTDLIFNEGIINFTSTTSDETSEITVHHTNWLNASKSCSFKLHPNYRPKISTENISITEDIKQLYRLSMFDNNSYLSGLSIEILSGPSWVSLSDSLGLLSIDLTDYQYNNSWTTLDLLLKITDNFIVPMSSEKNIKLFVYSQDDKPEFLYPLNESQYLASGLVEDVEWKLEFEIWDQDTSPEDLSVEFIYNPYSIELLQTGLTTFVLIFTPGNLVETSGLCTLVLKEVNNSENNVKVDVILFDIQQVDDSPVFLNNFQNIVISEKDFLEIVLDVDDVDSPDEDIWVEISGKDLGLQVLGIDALVRLAAPVPEDLSGEVLVKVCSSTSSCSTSSFNLTIKHVNDPPVFTQSRSETFDYYSKNHSSVFELLAEDPESNPFIFCVFSGNDVLIEDNHVVWHHIETEQVLTEFVVAVTDQKTCSDLESFTLARMTFCQCFDCCYLPISVNFSMNSNILCIFDNYSFVKVFVGSVACEGLFNNCCEIPNNYFFYGFKVFLENDFAVSNGLGQGITVEPENFNVFIAPDYFYGIGNEFVRVFASILIYHTWTCWISFDGDVREIPLFTQELIDFQAICVLPQVMRRDYQEIKLFVCPSPQSNGACKDFKINLKQEIVLKQKNYSGHDQGGYIIEIKVDFNDWVVNSSELLVMFNSAVIKVEKLSKSSIFVKIPPKNSESLVNLKVSVIFSCDSIANCSNILNWGSSEVVFEYTGSCLKSGYYCPNNTIYKCPSGHYCPTTESQLFWPLPCRAGSYQNLKGQSFCKSCPVGFMCPYDGLSNYMSCEAGFICDRSNVIFPFVTCPPGHYCESGTNTQVLQSGENYYTLRSSWELKSSDHWIERGQGFSSNSEAHYNSSFIPSCIKEYLSNSSGTNRPKKCPDGYFCSLAAISSSPLQVNNKYPMKCQKGYLCDSGDAESFNNTKACSSGSFCPNDYSGIYCRTDNSSCSICECPEGHYCPFQNMDEPTKCETGTYQSKCGMTTCMPCEPGFYCDEIGTDNLTVFMKICPSGYYCQSGSNYKSLCIPGTFNPFPGQPECFSCPRGYYCFTGGLQNPTLCDAGFMCIELSTDIPKPCKSGYYCPPGVSHFNESSKDCPPNEICPIICPSGHKCLAGSSSPSECTEGTYQPLTGQHDCLECEIGFFCPNTSLISMSPCTAGYFCSIAGLAAPFGQCPAGFYCLEGTKWGSSSVRRLELFNCDPADLYGSFLPSEPIPCPKAFYCSVGTASGNTSRPDGPKACSAGTFNDRCGQGQCFKCPEGFYCPEEGQEKPLICPLGTFRSGLTVNCEPCPVGTWGDGKLGLAKKEDCSDCPAGFFCDKTGTATQENMRICTSGFYCLKKTSKPALICPAGFFCPAGSKSLEEVQMKYPCPPGFYCPEQTVISSENFEKCKSDTSKCEAGKKCPINKFCPLGTNSSIPSCPEGTVSSVKTSDISQCSKDLNTQEKIYKTIDILDIQSSEGSMSLKLKPLQFAYFSWNTSSYPKANIPEDFVPFIFLSETETEVPFVQLDSYKPSSRFPLPLKYSTFISSSKSVFSFVLHTHQTVTVSFRLNILNGLYSAEKYLKLLRNSVKLISINETSKNKDSSFILVLARVSSSYFDEPSNLNFHGVLKKQDLSTIHLDFIQEISVSFLSSLPEVSEFFPQNLKKLWDELDISQNLYPLEYLPYVTDCEGFGAFVPIYQLYNHPNCTFISKDLTRTVQIMNPTQTPNGDSCFLKMTCKIAEKLDSSSKPWFSAYELSKANVFYVTRPQIEGIEYQNAIPARAQKENKFSKEFYGSGNLIEVKAFRGSAGYQAGMVPRNVRIVFEYYQKTLLDKEVLRAGIYFSQFENAEEDREYLLEFELLPLGWKDCLDLFAFEEFLYYLFVILVCFLILLTVVVFWLVSYVRSTILPRPNLKLGLYFKYSFKAFVGVGQATGPVFGLLLAFYYGLQLNESLKQVTGDYDDSYPISLTSETDSTRITKYMNGRLGTCIFILGWYLTFKTTKLLFPQIEKSENPKDLPSLNSKNTKMSSLFIWSTFSVLVFCTCTFQFAKSAVFQQYQTLFMISFQVINSQIVSRLRMKMKDNLYILPFFGALSLNTTLITVKVGAFTAFLTGYLTNVAIKIFKRAFIEPYRIQITNQVLRIKKKLKMTGSDVIQTLPFKDRVYIEQINDLGRNSMELVASVLFPAMIVFNFIFYNEMKLTISKNFLKYFIVFSSIQAFAEVGYDVFLNNAIECKTGRLLSEKITELKEIFENRETHWALSSALPHSGRAVVPELDNLVRFGFSSQYFFSMAVGNLAVVLQVYGIDFWMISSYNPFKDSVTLVLICSVPVFIFLAEKVFFKVLRIFLKEKNNGVLMREKEFFEEVRFFVLQEIEENGASSKYEVAVKAFGRACYEKYFMYVAEKQRIAAIMRFLKHVEELGVVGKVALEEIKNFQDLPFPKVRMKVEHLKFPKQETVQRKLKKKNGFWSPFLKYPWNDSSLGEVVN